jgi:hypothetical protein
MIKRNKKIEVVFRNESTRLNRTVITLNIGTSRIPSLNIYIQNSINHDIHYHDYYLYLITLTSNGYSLI